jgi:hypothetical protein
MHVMHAPRGAPNGTKAPIDAPFPRRPAERWPFSLNTTLNLGAPQTINGVNSCLTGVHEPEPLERSR